MLQVSYIRENRTEVLSRLSVRNFKQPELVDQILQLDDDRRQTQTILDSISAEANAAAKKIGELVRQGLKQEVESLKEQSNSFKEQAKTLSDKLNAIEILLQNELVLLPNLPHSSVPAGSTPEDNVVLLEHGQIPELFKGALPHWELATKYDIIDFELGNKIAGAGFPVYKGKGAKLQRALINFFLDNADAAGYHEVQPPIVVNEASGFGTGQLPDKEGQ
ncbi:MAG: serine--tRNA ligase, partial [Daejeonella sp.]